MITQEHLRHRLHYDEKTGIFTWKNHKAPGNNGKRAGTRSKHGYIQISVDGVRYPASNLAWLYVYGKMPDCLIDHWDTVRHHDWISNLREATHSQNAKNAVLYRNNKSGFKGVSYYKTTNKWRAEFCLDGKGKHLGYFDTPEEAHGVYCAAAKMHYGEFFNGGA